MTGVRVAIVSESFLPDVNGVAGSVARVLEHLHLRGHEALLVTPRAELTEYAGARVERVRSVRLPGYRSFGVGLPSRRLAGLLADFGPDVVHLASPVALGAHGAAVARRLGVPAVAVYQTDLAGFAERYGLGVTAPLIWWWLARVHGGCARTLAPSPQSCEDLRSQGIPDVYQWGRGVDTGKFSPVHRDPVLRRSLGVGEDQVLVGFVGRIAPEKRLELLAPLQYLEGCRLVLVGDGPARRGLERLLPRATFTGLLQGAELSAVVASLDIFVHAGASETFCQAVQEALAAGVPVVAPAAGGLPALVRPGSNGLLWPPDEPATLVRAVRVLVAQPALRREMGVRARGSVAGRGWEVLGDELLAHYRAVQGSAAERIAA